MKPKVTRRGMMGQARPIDRKRVERNNALVSQQALGEGLEYDVEGRLVLVPEELPFAMQAALDVALAEIETLKQQVANLEAKP